MNVGEALLALQALDLALNRSKQALQDIPQIKELAQRRKQLMRLKADHTDLVARRKDLELELIDLEDDERLAQAAVEEAQASSEDLTDYRRVQELEQRLSDLAKQLDKAAYGQREKHAQIDQLLADEQALTARTKKVEQAILDLAKAARAAAESIQADVATLEAKRERAAASLSDDALKAYAVASKRFKGLAVEKLEGKVPSICRMTLTESSLSDLERKGGITTCPYCHRILVRDTDAQ